MNALKQIFSSYKYIVLLLTIAGVVVLLSVLLPQYQSLLFILRSDVYAPWDKVQIIWGSLGGFQSLMTVPSQILTLLIAFLAGVNMSLGVLYMKQRIGLQRVLGTNFIGIVSGMVGIGCASCGSILITSFLGTGLATGFLQWLPWQGLEFGFIGLIVLLVSIMLTLKKIENPKACPVPLRN